MSSSPNSVEFKVGLLVLLMAVLFVGASLSLNKSTTYFDKYKSYYFITEDAQGLLESSAVRMAGIPIGTITKIQSYGDQARIDVSIGMETPIYQSAIVEITGDWYFRR